MVTKLPVPVILRTDRPRYPADPTRAPGPGTSFPLRDGAARQQAAAVAQQHSHAKPARGLNGEPPGLECLTNGACLPRPRDRAHVGSGRGNGSAAATRPPGPAAWDPRPADTGRSGRTALEWGESVMIGPSACRAEDGWPSMAGMCADRAFFLLCRRLLVRPSVLFLPLSRKRVPSDSTFSASPARVFAFLELAVAVL